MRIITTLCLSVLFFFSFQQLSAQCLTADAGTNKVFCAGGAVTLGPAQPVTNATYMWSPVTGLNNPNIANPLASPSSTTTYKVTVTSAGTNLLTNGDFGLGNSGFVTDSTYALVDTGNDVTYGGVYAITSSPRNLSHVFATAGDHTPNNAMMVVDGSTTAYAPCWQETISITPNTSYFFSGWYMRASPYNDLSDLPRLTVKINGVTVFGPQLADNLATWAQMTATWNSGSDTTATIAISSASGSTAGNDFALDDLYFSQSCNAAQASMTATLLQTPYFTNSWATDGFSVVQLPFNNLSGQNDICSQSFMICTVNASTIGVAWYIDGVQVTPGSSAPGFTGTVNITNMGQRLSVTNVSNDFSNHYFQVSAVGAGCPVLSSPMYVRRVPSILAKGTGYISANTIGTVSQRNTDYTFSLVNAITTNYGMGTTLTWSIPGITVTYPNTLDKRTITVNVPTGYTPSVDPGSGNHYIPGTVMFSGTSYACLNTTYAINFAVPANFPNRAGAGGLSGQANVLGNGLSGQAADASSGGLLLYPNPAQDLLYIRPGVVMDKDGYIEIFTSAGVRVRVIRASQQDGGSLLQVNVADLAGGLYFVAVHAGAGQVIRRKFVIAR